MLMSIVELTFELRFGYGARHAFATYVTDHVIPEDHDVINGMLPSRQPVTDTQTSQKWGIPRLIVNLHIRRGLKTLPSAVHRGAAKRTAWNSKGSRDEGPRLQRLCLPR